MMAFIFFDDFQKKQACVFILKAVKCIIMLNFYRDSTFSASLLYY